MCGRVDVAEQAIPSLTELCLQRRLRHYIKTATGMVTAGLSLTTTPWALSSSLRSSSTTLFSSATSTTTTTRKLFIPCASGSLLSRSSSASYIGGASVIKKTLRSGSLRSNSVLFGLEKKKLSSLWANTNTNTNTIWRGAGPRFKLHQVCWIFIL